MNSQATRKLIDSFPVLFQLFEAQLKHSTHLFHCGEGWYPLVYDLCRKLEEQANKEGRNKSNWPTISSVAQKYGTLRVDVENPSGAMIEFIIHAEEQSRLMCELCGESGRIYEGAWVVCRCEKCHKNPSGI